MGVETRGAAAEDGGTLLADHLVTLMKQVEMPNGLNAVGITLDDLPALVKGTNRSSGSRNSRPAPPRTTTTPRCSPRRCATGRRGGGGWRVAIH